MCTPKFTGVRMFLTSIQLPQDLVDVDNPCLCLASPEVN